MWRNLDSSLATKAMKMACLIAAALLIGSMAAPALAIKTDVVVLFNGDHLTGEVKELVHGQLMFKTDDVGTLYIEWDKIASLTTLQLLQIELADGRRFFGTAPESASKPGSIRILIGPFGESPTPIELSIHDIVRMAAVESGDAWYKRLDGSFSLGYSFTHANNLNVLNLSADIGSRDQVRKWKVAFDGQATSQANSPSSQRASQVSTLERFLPNRYYTEASLEFDRNEELGLYLRSLIGATFGRYLMQNKNSEFRAGVGLAASTEKSYDGTVGDNIEAQLTMSIECVPLRSPEDERERQPDRAAEPHGIRSGARRGLRRCAPRIHRRPVPPSVALRQLR